MPTPWQNLARIPLTLRRARIFHGLPLLRLLTLVFCAVPLFAQQFPIPDHPRFTFQNIPESLGLSTTTVTSLVQDHEGFLWIGTQAGLFRYDGLTVTRFGEEQWLRSSYITQLVLSPRGDLWVATHLGIWRYSAGKFIELAIPATAKVSHSGRQVLALDSDNQVFIATDKGVLRVNAADPHDIELITTDGSVSAICRTPKDTIVAAWQTKVAQITHESHKLSLLPGKLPDEIYALVTDGDGVVWARTEKHFSHWNGATKRWVPEDSKLPAASDFGYATVDHAGEILLPTSEGLYRRVNNHWEVTTLKQGMTSNAVSAALEDRDGAIWVGYVGAGVDRWPGRNEWVGWSVAEGLPDGVIWAVTRDTRMRVWVGTNDGISMWDPESHRWRNWKDRDGLAVGAIYRIVFAGDDSLWALSTSGGLTRIDLKTLQLESAKLPSITDTGFLNVAAAPDGKLWASGRGFVGHFGASSHHREFTPLAAPADARYATALLSFGKNGVLWTAGHTGVMRYDGKNWKHLTTGDGLRVKAIATLWAANDNEAWVTYLEARGATRIRIGENNHIDVQHYGTSTGLPSDALSMVAGDREGNLWFGSDHGIAEMRSNGKLIPYDRDSGLLWNDVNGGGFFEDPDGGIFIGTSRGLSYRRADAALHEKWTPNTILTSATFAGTDSLRVTEPKIQHKNATFEAKFAAPSFENTADQRCRYQLQGLDKEPVETRLREVRYTALPGGSYTFTVSCGSVSTGWGLPANYSFVVMPPWWLRWWAVALAVLLATLTLRWVIYLRTRALEKDRTLLEEAVEERSAELAAANRRLEELSLTDPLTGVQNRRFFDLVVPRQTQQALRAFQAAGPQRPPLDRDVVLFFVDLDHFKKVNDTYGHAAGDRALVEVVARLNSVVRQVDSLVRWGGEEFVIVSEGNSRETAHQMAQRILEAVSSEPIDLGDGKQQRLTCSVGWAPYPWFVSLPEKVGIDQVIVFADRGLYLAKSEGRNRAVGVLPASEDRNAAPLQNENQEVRLVRDVGPTGDCPPVAVTQESHIR